MPSCAFVFGDLVCLHLDVGWSIIRRSFVMGGIFGLHLQFNSSQSLTLKDADVASNEISGVLKAFLFISLSPNFSPIY